MPSLLLLLAAAAYSPRLGATLRPSASRPPPRHVSPRCSAAAGRRAGLLVVGLAGNNGVTLLAGQIANQRELSWESSRDGPRRANCLGCITQVGALSREFDFSSFSDLAVGGWDVVPTPLGEALYRSRILDYDLVRQVRGEMDEVEVMRGVWDADFYGESQREGATFVAPEATRSEQLERLRADIRAFQAQHGLGGEGGGRSRAGLVSALNLR